MEQIAGTDGYGTDLLLGSLRFRCDKLDQAGHVKLRSIIESIRQIDIRPSFEHKLSKLEAELNRVSGIDPSEHASELSPRDPHRN